MEDRHQIWRTGKFSVASVSFPGHDHEWALSWLLQKGRDHTLKEYRMALALVLVRELALAAHKRLRPRLASVLVVARLLV